MFQKDWWPELRLKLYRNVGGPDWEDKENATAVTQEGGLEDWASTAVELNLIQWQNFRIWRANRSEDLHFVYEETKGAGM